MGQEAYKKSEALCIIGAIALLNQVNIQEFKNNVQKATAMVMEGDLDG